MQHLVSLSVIALIISACGTAVQVVKPNNTAVTVIERPAPSAEESERLAKIHTAIDAQLAFESTKVKPIVDQLENELRPEEHAIMARLKADVHACADPAKQRLMTEKEVAFCNKESSQLADLWLAFTKKFVQNRKQLRAVFQIWVDHHGELSTLLGTERKLLEANHISAQHEQNLNRELARLVSTFWESKVGTSLQANFDEYVKATMFRATILEEINEGWEKTQYAVAMYFTVTASNQLVLDPMQDQMLWMLERVGRVK